MQQCVLMKLSIYQAAYGGPYLDCEGLFPHVYRTVKSNVSLWLLGTAHLSLLSTRPPRPTSLLTPHVTLLFRGRGRHPTAEWRTGEQSCAAACASSLPARPCSI